MVSEPDAADIVRLARAGFVSLGPIRLRGERDG